MIWINLYVIDQINKSNKNNEYTNKYKLLNKLNSFNDIYIYIDEYSYILASYFNETDPDYDSLKYKDCNGDKDINCDLIIYLYDIFKNINDKEDVINYIKSTNCMSLNMELDLIEKEFNEKSFTSSDEYTDLVDEDHGKKY